MSPALRRGAQTPFGASVVAVLLAASLVSGVELAALYLSGQAPPAAYGASTTALTLAAAALVGGVALVVTRRAAWALAAWAALELFASGRPGLRSVLVAVAGGGALGVVLVASGPRPFALAVSSACGVALGRVLVPPAVDSWPSGLRGALLGAGLAVAVTGCLTLPGRRERAGRVAGSLPTLGWIAVLTLLLSGRRSSPEPRPRAAGGSGLPNILVIILDTVAAEHMSLYGYARATTPELAAFVARSDRVVVYPLAFSPGNWTVPSHVSLLTGRLPSQHGANGSTYYSMGDVRLRELVAPWHLAEELSQRGYRTAAIFANPWLELIEGLERGFGTFERPPAPAHARSPGEWIRRRWLPRAFLDRMKPYPPADAINAAVTEQLGTGGPTFVLANYMEAHAPYYAPRPYRGRFADARGPVDLGVPKIRHSIDRLAELEARYDEEILGLDARIGELLRTLEQRGLLDDTWLFVGSDHGEAFGRHGATAHGSSLYNDQVRIPLIVQPPRGQTVPAVEEPVGLLDVTATICAIVGAPAPEEGRDLRLPGRRPHAVRMEFFGRPWLVSERGAPAGIAARAVAADGLKLIEAGGRHELFDLARDPYESTSVATTLVEHLARLQQWLPPPLEAPTIPADGIEPGKETSELLRSLGYAE